MAQRFTKALRIGSGFSTGKERMLLDMAMVIAWKAASHAEIPLTKSRLKLQILDFRILDAQLQFKLQIRSTPAGNGQPHEMQSYCQIIGRINGRKESVPVGTVEFVATGASGIPVMDYPRRHATRFHNIVMLETATRKRVLRSAILVLDE
ncbi:MAG: hypothetical protein M1818_003349 [Claussenomyces sp. TS43310]|nr:MAG: hypothetical protein M1818_003349 [Claussenomyces sp. TS43310]